MISRSRLLPVKQRKTISPTDIKKKNPICSIYTSPMFIYLLFLTNLVALFDPLVTTDTGPADKDALWIKLLLQLLKPWIVRPPEGLEGILCVWVRFVEVR